MKKNDIIIISLFCLVLVSIGFNIYTYNTSQKEIKELKEDVEFLTVLEDLQNS